jgi:hypothetical protein
VRCFVSDAAIDDARAVDVTAGVIVSGCPMSPPPVDATTAALWCAANAFDMGATGVATSSHETSVRMMVSDAVAGASDADAVADEADHFCRLGCGHVVWGDARCFFDLRWVRQRDLGAAGATDASAAADSVQLVRSRSTGETAAGGTERSDDRAGCSGRRRSRDGGGDVVARHCLTVEKVSVHEIGSGNVEKNLARKSFGKSVKTVDMTVAGTRLRRPRW